MRRSPDALNRAVLSLLGLLLLAASALALLLHYGVFGDDERRENLINSDTRDFWGDRSWLWWIVAGVSLLVALLALRWLREQLRAPRVGNADLERRSPQGSTRLRAGGAASALEQDLEEVRGVQSASARMVGDGPEAKVDLRVDVNEDADVDRVRQQVEEYALPRFRQAIEVDNLETDLRLDLAPPAGRRVR